MADIEDFMITLPKSERLITQRLYHIILNCDPRIRVKLSYGVPFFSINRRLCFIWPASAPQGPKDGKVSLGLCYGHLLSSHDGLLKMEGRTQVSVARFFTMREIIERTIEEIIMEAILVDRMKLKRKK